MLIVEMRRVFASNKKLRAVGSGPSIGHGQLTTHGVLDDKVFVVEFLPVNRLATRAVAVGEVTTLNHKVLDDSVEGGPLEMQWLASGSCSLFTSTEGPKVSCRLGGDILVQLHDNTVEMDGWMDAIVVSEYVPAYATQKQY